MSSYPKKAILNTIIYADIFDYPLTSEEIWKWLINVKSLSVQVDEKLKLKNAIKKLIIIKEIDGYYCIKKKEIIVAERMKREKYSQKKLIIAQGIANLLKLIPTIKLVGITGALAVNNAKKDDDIDLFIITSRGLLWTTRFLSTLLVEMTGKRRHPEKSNVNNKICLNMFVAEDYLEISNKEQDLFSAHEVLQMKPIFDSENTYQKFLTANQWVRKYLPNCFKIKNQKSKIKNNYDKSNIFSFIEPGIRKIQLWYMQKRRTTEIINDGIIRFHPNDAREWVMKEYNMRLKKFSQR